MKDLCCQSFFLAVVVDVIELARDSVLTELLNDDLVLLSDTV